MKSVLELINIRETINTRTDSQAGTITPNNVDLVVEPVVLDKFKNNVVLYYCRFYCLLCR